MIGGAGRQLDARSNAVGFLRLVFASLVIVDHAFPLGGFWHGTSPESGPSGVTLGHACVYGFFVLSGYLIVRSAGHTAPVRYLWHRALRILPAFWVALVGTALVLAPLAYHHSHGDLSGFWHAPDGPLRYLRRDVALHMHQYSVSGTPAGVPYEPPAWDGSLYTLLTEAKDYVIVLFLALATVLRRPAAARWVVAAWALVMWVAAVVAAGSPAHLRHVPVLRDSDFRTFTLFFALGAVAYTWRQTITYDDRIGSAAVCVAAATIFVGHRTWEPIGSVAFAYAVLWLAARLPFRSVGRKADYSYGVYVWAFPVAQLLSVYGLNKHGFVVYLVLTVAGTAVLAFASWHLVERTALRFKDWSPRIRRSA